MKAFLRTFFPFEKAPKFIGDGWVDSIEFRNSLIVVRKAARVGHDKLGDRIISGQEYLVEKFRRAR